MPETTLQCYGPHTLCCDKDQERPGTQLQFWNADVLVELLPVGYRKKANRGLFCIRNWIWWQQQSRFCCMGEKEEAGKIWSQGWVQFRRLEGDSSLLKGQEMWGELMIPLPLITATPASSGSAWSSAELTAQSFTSTVSNDANIS